MDPLTARILRDQLNTIPEDQLDQEIWIDWNDSGQCGRAQEVEIDPVTGQVRSKG